MAFLPGMADAYHLFNNKVFANASAIFSNYTFGIYDKYKVLPDEKNYYAEYYSGIRDLSLKYDIDFIPNPKHWIKAGAITIFHRFKPHAFVELDVPNNIDIKDIVYTDGIESGIKKVLRLLILMMQTQL